MEAAREPRSLQEATFYFEDPNKCREYVMSRRWPDGVECPACGSKDVIFFRESESMAVLQQT